MGAGKLALERIAIRSIAALSGSHDGRDNSASQVDFADDVIFAIGNVHRFAVIGHYESFRTGQSSAAQRAEPRGQRGSTIAGITIFPGTSDPLQASLRHIEQENAVAFPKSQKPSAIARNLERSRPG